MTARRATHRTGKTDGVEGRRRQGNVGTYAGRDNRIAQAATAEERRWAAKAGPITVRFKKVYTPENDDQ